MGSSDLLADLQPLLLHLAEEIAGALPIGPDRRDALAVDQRCELLLDEAMIRRGDEDVHSDDPGQSFGGLPEGSPGVAYPGKLDRVRQLHVQTT